MSEASEWPQSQVQAINEPPPNTWDDFERGCLITFRGGHHDSAALAAFQHGMRTIFNLLRAEFPPARQCKAAPTLYEACKAARLFGNQGTTDDGRSVDTMLRAAIAQAEGR